MTGKVITLQQLINASYDADSLADIINGAAWVEIETRLGRKCYSIATINAIITRLLEKEELGEAQIAQSVQNIIEKAAQARLDIDELVAEFDQEKDALLVQLQDAIDVALAAGAGAAGWTDALIQTWSGRNQREKNKESISLHDYCKATGVDDDTDAFKALINAAKLENKKIVSFGGKLRITSDVSLRTLNFDLSSTDIFLENCTLHAGSSSASSLSKCQKFGLVQQTGDFQLNPNNLTKISVKVWGSKCLSFNFDQIDYLQLFASTDPETYPTESSIGYCNFTGALVTKIELTDDPRFREGSGSGAGSRVQWINSNFFWIARIVSCSFAGGYSHNANVFYNATFETASAKIDMQVGNKNRFVNIRGEGYPTIYFGKETNGNIVERVWYSSDSSVIVHNNVTDEGTLNKVTSSHEEAMNRVNIFSINSWLGALYNGRISQYNNRRVTRKKIVSNTPYGILFNTKPFYIDTKDMLSFNVDNTGDTSIWSRYVVRVYLYDANMKPCTDITSDWFGSVQINAINAAGWVEGSINSATVQPYFLIRPFAYSKVRYMSIMVLGYGNISDSKSTLITCDLLTMRKINQLGLTKVEPHEFFNSVTSKPTQFIGDIGTVVQNIDGTRYTCRYCIETTCTNTVTNTALSVVTMNNGFGGWAVGDMVGLELDDGNTHWTTLQSVSGNNAVLAAAVPSVASVGNTVYLSRLV